MVDRVVGQLHDKIVIDRAEHPYGYGQTAAVRIEGIGRSGQSVRKFSARQGFRFIFRASVIAGQACFRFRMNTSACRQNHDDRHKSD